MFVLEHGSFARILYSMNFVTVQERTLRFVYMEYIWSCETLLYEAQLTTLHVRRIRDLRNHERGGTGMFEWLGQCKELVIFIDIATSFFISQIRTTCGKIPIRYTAASLWNSYATFTGLKIVFPHFESLFPSWNCFSVHIYFRCDSERRLPHGSLFPKC